MGRKLPRGTRAVSCQLCQEKGDRGTYENLLWICLDGSRLGKLGRILNMTSKKERRANEGWEKIGGVWERVTTKRAVLLSFPLLIPLVLSLSLVPSAPIRKVFRKKLKEIKWFEKTSVRVDEKQSRIFLAMHAICLQCTGNCLK